MFAGLHNQSSLLTNEYINFFLSTISFQPYSCYMQRCFLSHYTCSHIFQIKYRILHGKCARTVFTHELWRIRNRTSERSERVRFLIQNNECVNTVQSTFHVVLCLLYTYWDWTPSLNYDKLYLNKCGQTTITERKQLRKKRKSSNKIQNLWNKVGLSEFKAV